MTFTVTTWNILADAHIRPEYYPHTPPEWLTPEIRRPALLKVIRGMRCDVLCLQEVEESAFREIAAELPDMEGRYLKKGHSKPEGSATFVKGHVEDAREIRFSDGTGHVALMIRWNGVWIGNTHLRWKQGLEEMRQLLDNLPKGPSIVCGDLNVAPDSDEIRLAAECGLRPAHPDTAFTCNSNGKAKKIDFLLHNLKARPEKCRPVNDDTPMPSARYPSDHQPLTARFS